MFYTNMSTPASSRNHSAFHCALNVLQVGSCVRYGDLIEFALRYFSHEKLGNKFEIYFKTLPFKKCT